MFTGIVDGIASIVSIEKKKKFHSYTIKIPSLLSQNLKIGSSVAHNGCCLTVVKKIDDIYISCDVIKETLDKTNLGTLDIGSKVNIERSVKFGDEIGGHIVSGHIIDTASISKILILEDNYTIWIKVKNKYLMKYIFHKGFICVDGISLTVGEIIENKFCVNLIPQTISSTTIAKKENGSLINLEVDFYTQTVVDTIERMNSEKFNIMKTKKMINNWNCK